MKIAARSRLTALSILSCVALCGCRSGTTTGEPRPDPMADRALGGPQVVVKNSAAGEPINTMCPIGGHEFTKAGHSKDLTRSYNGKTIGFCCSGCTDAFDGMTAEEKTKVLNLALKNEAME